MTGHLLGAAGAIEAMAAIMAVKNGIIPPTINHTTPDPEIDPNLNLTLNVMQKRNVDIAISNTFGFGGHNAAVVIKKFNSLISWQLKKLLSLLNQKNTKSDKDFKNWIKSTSGFSPKNISLYQQAFLSQ